MITAHLPYGYILCRALKPATLVQPAAVLGGIFPDLDLIWFYFIDDRGVHNHRYWVHAHDFWLIVAAITLSLIARFRRTLLYPATAFLTAIALHLCLDSIAGDIMWLWPFSTELHSLITVPARYSHWVLNFILHPVFVLELAIWAAALTLWFRRA